MPAASSDPAASPMIAHDARSDDPFAVELSVNPSADPRPSRSSLSGARAPPSPQSIDFDSHPATFARLESSASLTADPVTFGHYSHKLRPLPLKGKGKLEEEDGAEGGRHDPNLLHSCLLRTFAWLHGLSSRVPLGKALAWIALLASILGFASVSPTFLYVRGLGVPALLVAAWRMQCMIIFFAPFVFAEVYRTPPEERARWVRSAEVGRWPVFLYVLWVSLNWATSLGLLVVSLKFTTTVRASLFGATYPMILLVYFRATGVKVSLGEAAGVLVGMIGIIITLAPAAAATAESGTEQGSSPGSGSVVREAGMEWIGDLMNLVNATLIATNVLLARKARKVLPVFTYSAACVGLAGLFLSIGSLLGEDTSLLGATVHSLFGWTNPDLVLLMLLFGLIVSLVGTLGFNYAVKYMDPVVFSTMQLLNPVFTGLISWLWGLEAAPSPSTVIGGLIVLGGIVLVSVYEARRKRREEEEEVLRSSEPTEPPSSTPYAPYTDPELEATPQEATDAAPSSSSAGGSLLAASAPRSDQHTRGSSPA